MLGTLDYVIYVGSGICVTECKHELEFPWKSNVVLGLCGLKSLRIKKKVNGFKIKRSEQFDPLETSSLCLMKKVMFYVVIRQNLGGL